MKSLFSEILLTRLHARLLIILCSLLATVFGLFGPFLQKEFIDQLTGSSDGRLDFLQLSSPVGYVLLAFFAVLTAQGFAQLTTYLGAREAIFMQRIFAGKLYAKTLSLRVDTMSRRPVGEIVAIYATDVPGATVLLDQTLPAGATTIFPLILAPFAISMLFDIPIWPTLQVMLFIVILNSLMAYRQSRYFFNFKQMAAERTGLVNEWIQNIRTIRILGWIHYFEKAIFRKREVETMNRVSMVTNGQIMNAISSSITFALNVITLYSLVYYSKHAITSGELLALLWIVGVFLNRPFRQMPWFFTFAFDSWTSVRRLESYLNTANSLPDTFEVGSVEPLAEDTAIELCDLNLQIGARHILSNISLKIQEGEFVAVVGEVGSGKTMLLLSLLGETGASFKKYHVNHTNILQGDVAEARTHYAYVPQEGFIMNASLRENVGFIYDLDKEHDADVSESLKLAQFDLSTERVENGLDTEIGERGVNLSGGQKQRVSLARVHFYDAPILLLDDSLSAVDVDTEQKIFDQLLLGEWRNRTRILVTHRLSALQRVDRILFMEEGRIVDQGHFDELIVRNKKFQEYTTSVAQEKIRE